MLGNWTTKQAALVLDAALLGAVLWLGGWAWSLLMAVALVEIRMSGASVEEEWRTVCPALLWVALSSAAGDRRLMFPFALHLAAGMGVRRGWAAGVGEVALFALIRWAQGATGHVLGVEMLAAGPALALGIWTGRFGGLVAASVGLVGLLL